MSLNYYAPRSCYEFVKGEAGWDIKKTGGLSSYRECPAYVLLGQPGSGKTTAFEEEAKQPGCEYVSARDFITFDVNLDWRDKTLFIDGLDEVRAGRSNTLWSFDEIRKKLCQLGQLHFRLSCREADWYGEIDRKELEKVSPNYAVNVLFLADLEDEYIPKVLVKNYHKTVSDASSFLEQARRRELTDLIKNPQTLEMLVTAVTEETAWPERKSEVFKLACEKLLLVERNKTHDMANRNQSPPVENLMQASGMLCAVMLLARKDGFALSRSDQSENYPFIADMADDEPGFLQQVAKTRLFTTHDGRTEYNHRIFAEYLSACYLSNKIDNKGLPVGRALALMTGTDGGVVAELRGVYAWLTTICHKERTRLMQRDPLGVVLYGDVSLFSKEDRLKLLHDLSEHAENTGGGSLKYLKTQSFGALCQADMEPDFRGILESNNRSETHQFLLMHVLASMTHGKELPGLSDELVRLLQNPGGRLGIRKRAMQVLSRFDDEQTLLNMLADIGQNIIPDPDDDLLGELLLSLYPHRITTSEIFNYFRPPKKPNYIGDYDYFWCVELTRLSTDDQVAQLLDALVTIQAKSRRGPDEYTYRTMVGNLLVRGVEASGATVETERLSDWLGLGLDEFDSSSLLHEDAEDIRKWLERHPEIQKSLIERQLNKCGMSGNFDWCTSRIRDRLFNADLPGDYGRWCLDKARATENEQVAKYLFWQSVSSLDTGKGNVGLCRELVENAAAKDARFKRDWDEYSVREINPEYGISDRERVRQRDERDRDKKAFVQFIRNNLANIEAGTAKPGIFSKLASAYYGYFIESRGDNPVERLRYFFDNDIGLVQAILNGLPRFIHREDIPDVTEIFRVHMENKHLVYSHPYRAGMDELARSGIQTLLELSEEKIAKALAFYFADRTEETVWYKTILEERPELVARVYTLYGTMALRAGKIHITGSYQLAFGDNHKQMARLAVLPLLESFRTRSTSEQLAPLYDLLAAALQHAERNRLKQLTEKKLSLKSMDAAQSVLWLASGFILAPEQFAQQLTEFVSEKEARINYLSGFLSYRSNQWKPVDRLSLQGVSLLIELLGPCYAPVSISDDDYLSGSASFASSEVIMQLISRLATFLTDEATAVIESLLRSDHLSTWRPRLTRILYAQSSAKREAVFRHASLKQVLDTLKNGPPANAADLVCITRERIRELADRIKYENTNDFRQYWKKYPKKRQHEEMCRDLFLSDLRPLLKKMQIDAQPEGRYAAEGRADIRVSFMGYSLPIEIKCNDSKDLWHGIRDQLIQRYTTDPDAHGYGIYLVFWFDHEKTPPHPESGPKPRTPTELEERLSQLLKNDEERKKISVCVVDCIADGQVKTL